jgi:hypothetical protein
MIEIMRLSGKPEQCRAITKRYRTNGVWAAAIFPIGHAEVFGGMWDSDQLHWTRAAAVSEIEARVTEMGLLPMEWTRAEGDLIIGRTHYPGNEQRGFAVMVRSVRLPKGEPPSTGANP